MSTLERNHMHFPCNKSGLGHGKAAIWLRRGNLNHKWYKGSKVSYKNYIPLYKIQLTHFGTASLLCELNSKIFGERLGGLSWDRTRETRDNRKKLNRSLDIAIGGIILFFEVFWGACNDVSGVIHAYTTPKYPAPFAHTHSALFYFAKRGKDLMKMCCIRITY